MGRDITLYLTKLNRDTGKYDWIRLYRDRDGEKVLAPVYSGRNSELFNIMSNRSDEDIDLKTGCIVKASLDPELIKKIDEASEYCYDFRETTLADMKIACYQTPLVRDYDSEDEHAMKKNPLDELIHICYLYLDFADPYGNWYGLDSDIKLIYWFDS